MYINQDCITIMQSQVSMTMLGIRIIFNPFLGLASMTVPIYLAECSPVHLRGRLTVADNMAVTGGQFVAGVIDYAFSYVSHGWRYNWMHYNDLLVELPMLE